MKNLKKKLQTHCSAGLTAAPFWHMEAENVIADRIAHLMDELDCPTQKAFADQIGYSLDAVNRWINENRAPHKTTQMEIAKVFGVRPSEMFAYFSTGKPLPNRRFVDRVVAEFIEQPEDVQDVLVLKLQQLRSRAGPTKYPAVSGK